MTRPETGCGRRFSGGAGRQTVSSRNRKRKSGTIKHMLPGKPRAARVRGQPAFIKPNVNWDGDGVVFNWCDQNGSGVSAKDVRIGDTMSLQQARVEAGINWDASEAARVGEHNLSLVVCWARVRLYRSVAAGQSSVGATASQASGRTAAFGG